MRMKKGNNTIFFILIDKVPIGKTATYVCIVAEIRPHRAENHCVHITLGGYRLEFEGVTST